MEHVVQICTTQQFRPQYLADIDNWHRKKDAAYTKRLEDIREVVDGLN